MMWKVNRCLRDIFGGKKPPLPESKSKAKEKTKKSGSLMKSFRERDKNALRFSNINSNNKEEENKSDVTVRAATKVAVEAAVTAARVGIVAELSREKMTLDRNRKELAAIKIQTAFRAYLARRALVALKGLVKLQALVRGNIVRKQNAEYLRCMQALIRVQARACAYRAIRSEMVRRKLSPQDETDPNTPEKYELARTNSHMLCKSSTLKRNPSRHTSANVQTMEECYLHLATNTPIDEEMNARIQEIDPRKPQHSKKSKRKIMYPRSLSPMTSDNTQSFTTAPDSSSKDSSIAQQFPNQENHSIEDNTQFFSASSSRAESSKREPSPASEFSVSLYSEFYDYPRYMADTMSSKAKVVRSQSAPKQRPAFEKLGSLRRHSGQA